MGLCCQSRQVIFHLTCTQLETSLKNITIKTLIIQHVSKPRSKTREITAVFIRLNTNTSHSCCLCSAVWHIFLESDLFYTTGEQLQINQPDVYDCDVPESLASLVPSLAEVCETKHLYSQMVPDAKAVANRSVTLTSKEGTDFISFAKGAAFDNGTTLEDLF